MRMPETKIKEAILHPDKMARLAAVSYFSLAFSRDAEVMSLVIQAFEKYGRSNAFTYLQVVHDLLQTEATVEWLIRELVQQDGDNDYLVHLGRLLADADPHFLLPYKAEILQAPGFRKDFGPVFQERLDLLTWDAEKCWHELERIAEEGKNKHCARKLISPTATGSSKRWHGKGKGKDMSNVFWRCLARRSTASRTTR